MILGVDVASMLLGGVAAGMVLFIVSVGLSVTMGLMGFVNLAHGGFAMLGGYAIVQAMQHWGIGFVPALAFLIFGSAAAGTEFKFGEVALLTVFLTVMCALVFVWGIGLPYPLFAGF